MSRLQELIPWAPPPPLPPALNQSLAPVASTESEVQRQRQLAAPDVHRELLATPHEPPEHEQAPQRNGTPTIPLQSPDEESARWAEDVRARMEPMSGNHLGIQGGDISYAMQDGESMDPFARLQQSWSRAAGAVADVMAGLGQAGVLGELWPETLSSHGLHFAVLADDEASVRRLLEMGADPNDTSVGGATPLMDACIRGHAGCPEGVPCLRGALPE